MTTNNIPSPPPYSPLSSDNLSSEANPPLIICDNLVKIYKVADLEVVALQGPGAEALVMNVSIQTSPRRMSHPFCMLRLPAPAQGASSSVSAS